MSDAKTFVAREKKQFGGAYRWCLVFKYAELGIDLIRVDTGAEFDLKMKYKEMGVDYEEEVDESMPQAVQNEIQWDEFIKK